MYVDYVLLVFTSGCFLVPDVIYYEFWFLGSLLVIIMLDMSISVVNIVQFDELEKLHSK